jgi:hypothetical protein
MQILQAIRADAYGPNWQQALEIRPAGLKFVAVSEWSNVVLVGPIACHIDRGRGRAIAPAAAGTHLPQRLNGADEDIRLRRVRHLCDSQESCVANEDGPDDCEYLAPEFGRRGVIGQVQGCLISDQERRNRIEQPNDDAKGGRPRAGESDLAGAEREAASDEADKQGPQDSRACVVGSQQSVDARRGGQRVDA